MVNKPTEAELIRQMGDRLAKINGLDAVESKTDVILSTINFCVSILISTPHHYFIYIINNTKKKPGI